MQPESTAVYPELEPSMLCMCCKMCSLWCHPSVQFGTLHTHKTCTRAVGNASQSCADSVLCNQLSQTRSVRDGTPNSGSGSTALCYLLSQAGCASADKLWYFIEDWLPVAASSGASALSHAECDSSLLGGNGKDWDCFAMEMPRRPLQA